jgi:hypothetical protein
MNAAQRKADLVSFLFEFAWDILASGKTAAALAYRRYH